MFWDILRQSTDAEQLVKDTVKPPAPLAPEASEPLPAPLATEPAKTVAEPKVVASVADAKKAVSTKAKPATAPLEAKKPVSTKKPAATVAKKPAAPKQATVKVVLEDDGLDEEALLKSVKMDESD